MHIQRLQTVGSLPALLKSNTPNEPHTVRWQCKVQSLIAAPDIYTQQKLFHRTCHLHTSKHFGGNSHWSMLHFQEINSLVFLRKSYRLPNPVSHSKARRWSTVSIRCPLCKSQQLYIILWFICANGRRRTRLRHAINITASVKNLILDINLWSVLGVFTCLDVSSALAQLEMHGVYETVDGKRSSLPWAAVRDCLKESCQ